MIYQAVLLDLYDTVVWSDWRAWQGRLSDVLGISHETLSDAFALTRPARSVGTNADVEADMRAVLDAADVDGPPELIDQVLELERQMAATVTLYDDSLSVVRGLRKAGVATALVSNCSHNTRPIVDRLGLEREFDAVILSVEVGAMKPDPAIYREALARLGDPDPGRSVFVDDQVRYCDGAAALGLQTFLILRPEEALEGRPTEFNGHRPIETLEPLLGPDGARSD